VGRRPRLQPDRTTSRRSADGSTRRKAAPTRADGRFARCRRPRPRVTANVERLTRLKDEHLPRAKRYTDYREMLDTEKGIDAVIVATPDHMHASIALAAMDLGKHVYVQKPLTWSVAEARQLARKAKETKVATQMGNQGHSSDEGRRAVEYVWAGAIGDVREFTSDESSARLLAAGRAASSR
jgi:predicted dehydrogenase